MINLGVDIGGTTIKAGLVDRESCTILEKASCRFEKEGGPERTAADIRKLADELCEKHGIKTEELGDIGVDVPGSVSSDFSTVLNAYNLGYHNAPIKELVQKQFPGQNVYLANDADAAALAELYAGVFKGKKTAILLTLGTGLGGGVIINGKLFRGGNGNGTEPGHAITNHVGLMCTCGNRGCMETECAATWLVDKVAKGFDEGESWIKDRIKDRSEAEAKVVFDAVGDGVKEALDIFEEYTENLAIAITSFTSILDPEIIGIGGGVSNAGEMLLRPLREKVKAKNFFKYDYPIERAVMGNDAGILGAAMLADHS